LTLRAVERSGSLITPGLFYSSDERTPVPDITFDPTHFSDDYKVDMVQAYPYISGTPYPGTKHPFFTLEKLDECFARVLANKNLARTHQSYLDERYGPS